MMCALVLAWMALLVFAGEATAQRNSAAPATVCVGVDFADDEHAQAAPREATCLRELRKSASRKGDLLTLRLANGASKTYRDNPKACGSDDAGNCIHYSLVGYHPLARLYSILVRYYEGSRCDLVSARTGNAVSLSAVPHFSPDGSSFIVIDNDVAYGGPYDIAVGSTASDPPSLVWQHREHGLVEWHLQHWIDNNRAVLRAIPAGAPETCQRQDCDAILVRFGTTWTIRRPPPKQD